MHAAVSGRDLQLRQQRESVAVERALALETEPAPVPAVAQQEAQLVAPAADQVRDVVRLVAQPVLVGGPARRQDEVADAAAVECGDVEAVRGGVQPGLDHLARYVQRAAQHRRGCVQITDAGRAHEGSGPVGDIE